MLVENIQQQLAAFYETPFDHCINDFLVTDGKLARLLQSAPNATDNGERLLLMQSPDGLDVSLYIDETILEALSLDDPYVQLTSANLNDFLIALEGVSHFNYVVWHAGHERPVTRLELELQAEVDKFVTGSMLFASQGELGAMEAFHEALFSNVRFHPELDHGEETRYRDANRYAAKYCITLTRRFRHQHDQPSFVNELRRFYRLPQNEKIRCIETGTA